MDRVLGLIFTGFTFLWAIFAAGFLVVSFLLIKDYLRFLNYLRNKRSELWQSLGGRTMLFFYPLKLFFYVWKEEYRNAGDEGLNEAAIKLRKRYKLFLSYGAFALIVFLLFSIFWIGAMYFASTEFRDEGRIFSWKSWNGTYLVDFSGQCDYQPGGETKEIIGQKILEVRNDKIVQVDGDLGVGPIISSTNIDDAGKATVIFSVKAGGLSGQETSNFTFTRAADGDYYFVADDTKDFASGVDGSGQSSVSCKFTGRGEQVNKTNDPLTGLETIL
jgi:hypothetical protein